MTSNSPQLHILSVTVENKFGVLARVAGLFARRGYNIFSLAVAPCEEEGLSNITIVVDVESALLEQVTKQLFKLIEVIEITELDPVNAVERELLLATVSATSDAAPPVDELIATHGAVVVERNDQQLSVSLVGEPGVLDEFGIALVPYGIVELQRTGRVALRRLDPNN